jgi:pyruvate,orthophosphate dikinase
MREMILAADLAARQVALDRLLPIQRGDFLEIFRAMDGLPVTIRLLDPPLHEFLPKYEELQEELYELTMDYTIGTMIELPRAALVADRIAAYADFFSFGTNDLTQTTFGLSRDDSGRFLSHYITEKLLADDPFQVLDQSGVGQLVQLGVERGRQTKPNLKTGICGEHGGEPRSIAFCHRVGLDYVSCSPYRVPIARLAAAQASLAD